MGSDGKFVAIRMIVLNPDIDKSLDFENWMKKTFLVAMADLFKPDGWLHQGNRCPGLGQGGLEKIIFFRGIKQDVPPYPLQSHQHAAVRTGSSEAGANADYAWITLWTNREANRAAWSCGNRPETWYNDDKTGLWNQFRDWCFPRFEDGEDSEPARPEHGPPYDYLGSGSQRGSGAGCLVEGFEVVWEWEYMPQS